MSTLFLEAFWLDMDHNHGYGSLPIPAIRDEEITELVSKWSALDDSERMQALASITTRQVWTLLAYSERMASRAVRERDRGWIRLGLIAQGLVVWHDDWRDNVQLLSLHYDACRRVSVSPDHLFTDISTLFPPDFGVVFTAFLKRRPEDRSIDAMGYREGADGEGFLYERNW